MIQDIQGTVATLAGESLPPFQTAEEYAYQSLRRLILTGKLPGGTRLNQEELARRLNVSRTPIRQAVLRLGNEGLLVVRPNRSAFITTLGPAAMLELFEMRSVLEGLAFSLAIPNIDARRLEEISKRLDALERAQSNISRWVQLHDEFHAFLFESALRPRLIASVRQLRQSVAPYLRLYLSTNKIAEMPGNEHRSLIAAIKRGDAGQGERLMREHVMSAAHGVVEFVRQHENQRQTGGSRRD